MDNAFEALCTFSEGFNTFVPVIFLFTVVAVSSDYSDIIGSDLSGFISFSAYFLTIPFIYRMGKFLDYFVKARIHSGSWLSIPIFCVPTLILLFVTWGLWVDPSDTIFLVVSGWLLLGVMIFFMGMAAIAQI